jgi:hypothetical protein
MRGKNMSDKPQSPNMIRSLMAAAAIITVAVGAAVVLYAIDIDRAPVRVIRDPYPTFSAVAVDMDGNEIVLQDENLFGFAVYDRLTNTPASARFSEPKRIVQGPQTFMEFNCGLYVDQKTGDIYSVNNDTIDTLTVFSRQAKGNVAPDRMLETPHRSFGIAVDEASQGLFTGSWRPEKIGRFAFSRVTAQAWRTRMAWPSTRRDNSCTPPITAVLVSAKAESPGHWRRLKRFPASSSAVRIWFSVPESFYPLQLSCTPSKPAETHRRYGSYRAPKPA